MLGPLEIVAEGRTLPLKAAKQKTILGLLLLHRDEVVSVDRLHEALWNDRPPATATTALQGYVSQLRRLLEEGEEGGASLLVTRSPGYSLTIPPEQIDVARFEQLAQRGRDELAAGEAARGAALLAEALALWRGPPLADFSYEAWAQSSIGRLEELRLSVLEDRIEADLACGRHGELVGELESLIAEQPSRERLRGQLMLALYRGGRQADALEAYQAARRSLVEELGIEPGTELQELNRLILNQDEALVAPQRAAVARRPIELPVPPNPLIGRERELRELLELLKSDDIRLLTMTGAGGIGKTRLALQLAAELAEEYPDGVFFVSLAQIRDPLLVVPTIAQTLGVKEHAGRPLATTAVGRDHERAEANELMAPNDGPLGTLSGGSGKTILVSQATETAAEGYPEAIRWERLDLVVGAIGGKQLIVLLDNFEHVIDAAGEVGALVVACPKLRVLVTSRERLQVAGEHEYAVPAMAPLDALALFVARARALGVAEVHDHEAARELCERLDNLPLALELAAARTKLFSPAQLLERLGQRLDLFKGGRDADPRHRTLRATIEWSHDLLSPEEQRLFARLSVFAGGCGYEAAAEICDADEDTLQSLLDKSLVHRRDAAAGEQRYWMLETIRQFAAERLEERSEREAVTRRHAEWHASLADQLQQPMRNGDPDATARMTAEIDNIRGALEWLARHEEVREGLRIVWGLWYFWVQQGQVVEGLRWARWAVAEAPKVPPRERAYGLLGASELLRMFGDSDLALRLKREIVPQFRELGLENLVAATLADISELLAVAGDFDEARRLGSEALALRRRLGARGGIAHALATLGRVEFQVGDFARARELYEEAMSYAEEPYMPTNVATAALMAGESARREGDPGGAAPLLARALRLFQELGARGALPEVFQEIASATSNRPADAVRLLGASERLLAETAMPRWDPADHERTVARLRAELGASAFEEAWAAGASLSDEEVLSLAARCLG